MKVKLTTNRFRRVIITQRDNPLIAWTGTEWAEIDAGGLAAGKGICNFTDEQEARDYCRKHRIEIQ